jgi:hypothetical protein
MLAVLSYRITGSEEQRGRTPEIWPTLEVSMPEYGSGYWSWSDREKTWTKKKTYRGFFTQSKREQITSICRDKSTIACFPDC